MSISETEPSEATARGLTISDDAVTVDIADGRTITAPSPGSHAWHMGHPMSGRTGVFIGNGEGIHWPDLDEDISVQSLLAGRRSGESQSSLRRWLKERER
jgi:hypothetical protein